MSLFGIDPSINILPRDGIAHYYGPIWSAVEATHYMERLLHTISWQNDEVLIYGKHIVTPRKVAWVGDINYTYSGKTHVATAWTTELSVLKERVEQLSGATYNSCLLNLYHSGEEGMGWHCDDETTLARNSAIASLSFGAERKFAFRHKETKETVALTLENSSLLVMQGTTQAHWQHSLPKTARIKTPRINLTFRTMVVTSAELSGTKTRARW